MSSQKVINSDVVINNMKKWLLSNLSSLNEDVYLGKKSHQELAIILNKNILDMSPSPEKLDLDNAKKLLVILGIIGSSIERHTQQCFIKQELMAVEKLEKDKPDTLQYGKGLDLLMIPNFQRFTDYFGRVADIIAHPHRDSFFTFIECNGPTVKIIDYKSGNVIHTLPTLFSDNDFITFSGQQAEIDFITLLKQSFVAQEAANKYIKYIQKEITEIDDSSTLMLSICSVFINFMKNSQFNYDFFLDILRQYACQWYPPNQYLRPPSGANDHASLDRDVMLFENLLLPDNNFPGYNKYIQGVFSVLMPNDIAKLKNSMAMDTIEKKIFDKLGINKMDFNQLNENSLLNLLKDNYWLSIYLQLYNAQKKLSIVHYSSIQKYLVKPKKYRDVYQDRRETVTVVSNELGTTGMNPKPNDILWLLNEARINHPLAKMNSGVTLKKQIKIALDNFNYQQLGHTKLSKLIKIC
jgi:hypothetical protein